ncbi:hypothetical protein LPJ70_006522 [Coemansia sp. RSA 2708]|nr:hypothetical protein LPJ70_006522 [Coemansia sp. RSA 2708]
MAVGRFVHFGVDLVLVSMVLAGTRRSSGLTPALSNPDSIAQSALRTYLDMGERLLTYAETQMASSGFFKRS